LCQQINNYAREPPKAALVKVGKKKKVLSPADLREEDFESRESSLISSVSSRRSYRRAQAAQDKVARARGSKAREFVRQYARSNKKKKKKETAAQRAKRLEGIDWSDDYSPDSKTPSRRSNPNSRSTSRRNSLRGTTHAGPRGAPLSSIILHID